MASSVDCPHTKPMAGRDCDGCTETAEEGSVDRAVERWCDGEVTGTVVHDSDGDAGVINGIRHFVTVEDLELTCGCILSAAEQQSIIDKLAEFASEPLDMADDLAFPY